MMDWDVLFDGISIKDKVKSVKLSKQRDSFCREVDIELIDTSLYSQINWAQIPSAPRIEVLADGGSGWASLGKFFVERPTYEVGVDERGLRGIWGRSSVAVLAEPFAKTITKTWTQTTTLYAIIDEVLSGTGVVLWRPLTTIPDFVIDPLAYSADKQLPIDIITDLAELCGAVVLSDNTGNVFLQQVNYAPAANDIILNDIDIEGYTEEIIFPEFANRVRILADESSSGVEIEIAVRDECVLTGGAESIAIMARISDDDGNGINNVPVDWASQKGLVSLGDGAVTNTYSVLVSNEQAQSEGFYSVNVQLPPKEVSAAFWVNDTERKDNIALGGYTIDGKTIIFDRKLAFCDQTLVITYTCDGVAINHYSSGSIWGEDTITASVAGATAKQEIHIGNPCKCADKGGGGDSDNDLDPKAAVQIVAIPSAICVGVDTGNITNPYYCPCPTPGCVAGLLVSAENYGPVMDGRIVTMKDVTESGALGELKWFRQSLDEVTISNVPGTIIAAPDRGTCIATTGHYWMTITKVEYLGPPEVGHPNGKWTTVFPTMLDGKAITFPQNYFHPYLVGGGIRVSGRIYGAAVNHFASKKAGTAQIEASVQFLREAPEKATCEIQVGDGSGGDDSNPNFPGKKDDDKKDWDYSVHTKCVDGSGKIIPCVPGTACCQQGGKYGCYPVAACSGGGGPIQPDPLPPQPENPDCSNAPGLLIAGPDTVGSNSGTQYTASGGIGPYTWSAVGGDGVAISQDGILTLTRACGTITLTVTDNCQKSTSKSVRVVDGGTWKPVENSGDYAWSQSSCWVMIDGQLVLRQSWSCERPLEDGIKIRVTTIHPDCCGNNSMNLPCISAPGFTPGPGCPGDPLNTGITGYTIYRWSCA